jgi:hypothetical protein
MRCTYFSGPWKGMGAAIEDCSEETGHSVAHLLRLGADRVLQEYHATGRITASATVRESKAGRPAGSVKKTAASRTEVSSDLAILDRERMEARDELNRLRAEWPQFCLQHGEQGKERARNGGPGVELWLCLKHAIERERAAVDALAEARLAMTPTFKRKEVV